MTKKFDNIDRKHVIEFVEELLNIKLTRVGKRSKWLKDEAGVNYWIVGGVGDWHGIPEEMMESERLSPAEGILVVAQIKTNSLNIYMGKLGRMVRGRNLLFRAKKTTGDYQFTIKDVDKRLIIKQINDYRLDFIESIKYAEQARESERRIIKAKKIISKLSPEIRRDLLEGLKNNH